MTTPLSDLALSDPELLVSGGDSEGPVWHPDGHLLFVRFTRNELLRWDPQTAEATVVRTDTGRGTGCAVDRDGYVLMCESDHRTVTRMSREHEVTTVAEMWNGRRLNAPNDVVCRSDGTVYFTDPQSRRSAPERELGFAAVFLIKPDGVVRLATDAVDYPNGLAFNPDESILYVVMSRRDERCYDEVAQGAVCPHRRILAFDVHDDGALTGARVFCDMTSAGPGAPDGMTVDAEGNVYCTNSDGVWVVAPSGARLGTIVLPERPRNLAFGGPSGRELYVTAGASLYRLSMSVRGAASA
jgi:gluconolactonase